MSSQVKLIELNNYLLFQRNGSKSNSTEIELAGMKQEKSMNKTDKRVQ